MNRSRVGKHSIGARAYISAATTILATIILTVAFGRAQTVNEVVSFTGNNSQGMPDMTPTQGRDGNLYGTCPNPKDTYGSIFSLTSAGGLSSLYTFSYTTGYFAVGLTLSTDGNFYGTGGDGGTGAYGVLFRISPNGTYTLLHDFLGSSDGAGPTSPPIQGSDGNLYGTTTGSGGIFSSTVYKYTRSGAYSTIFEFSNTQGKLAAARLVQGSDGNLYGTAVEGGTANNGTIYKLSTSGTLLYNYSFPASGKFGVFPSELIEASDGNFYGTTSYGGTAHDGTVFRMNQKGIVSVLYNFAGADDGANPSGGVVQGTDGNLYGATSARGTYGFGTIFQISLSGQFQSLYSFDAAIGENPGPPPLQHTNGLFYGALQSGSTYGYGAIYSLDMGLGPFVTFVLPVGKVGKTAEILGQGLTGTTSVTFNGIPATSFAVKSDTYMTAVVPTGASTGPVVVTTPAGTLTSNVKFRISK